MWIYSLLLDTACIASQYSIYVLAVVSINPCTPPSHISFSIHFTETKNEKKKRSMKLFHPPFAVWDVSQYGWDLCSTRQRFFPLFLRWPSACSCMVYPLYGRILVYFWFSFCLMFKFLYGQIFDDPKRAENCVRKRNTKNGPIFFTQQFIHDVDWM